MQSPFEALTTEIEAFMAVRFPDYFSTQRIADTLKQCWQSPHSAMEMLLVVAKILPLPAANSVVREVVTTWKSMPNYSWTAGGSADHCFLAALALSGNPKLADEELVTNQRSTVIRHHGKAELTYGGDYKVIDATAKARLVRAWLANGQQIELEKIYDSETFAKSCEILAPDFGEIDAELIAYFSRNPDRLHT